jgi:ABC-2 type transport system ATP-binding protein
MPPPAVVFRHICKSYRQQQALADISFEIADSECFGLAGLNGAGKTTLLKCLLGLCRPDTGEVAVFGAVRGEPSFKQDLAYLPERWLPPYYQTAREMLRFALKLQGGDYAEATALHWFRRFDLGPETLDLPARLLSKGMTQKLGIIAALAGPRRLLVLDEPASGLDPLARMQLNRELAAQKSTGRTLLLASHLLHDMEVLCDRVAVLHGGKLLFVGPPAQLRERYQALDLEQGFLRCIGAGNATPAPALLAQ